MTITKERFEAWLFSQPRERSFDYMDTDGCLVCSFLNETVSGGKWSAGGNYFRQPLTLVKEPIPLWLCDLIEKAKHKGIITIASAQDTFLAMNPSARQTDMATGLAITPTQEGCLNVSCTQNKT